MHNSNKRYLGEFYTPLSFAKKAIDYIYKYISKEELASGKYRIWDMACGLGNLEYYFDSSIYKYLYMSTIREEDVLYCKNKFIDACIFQYDYLNDDIYDNNIIYTKIPEKLKRDLEDKSIKWIIFINPPYATSQVAGTNSKSKKNVSSSLIRDIMHREKLGESSRELYIQFLYRIHKEFFNKSAYLFIFSKTNYIKSNNNEKIRNTICNYKFMDGFLFSSINFDDTSKQVPFVISFIMWQISNSHNIKNENIILDVLNDDTTFSIKKNYSVVDSNNLLNKWIKRVRTSETFVPLSSAIKVKTNGNDIRDKVASGFIGSLMSCGSDLMKQNLTSILSAPQASAGSLSITKDNFEKAMIIHAIRRSIKVNWLNSSDQFIIPKEDISRVFILDCIVWTLFSSSNQTSSMDNVYYNEKYYKVVNHFYPFRYMEVYDNNSFFDFDGQDRFVAIYIEENKKYLSKEAIDLLEKGKELYKFFYSNIDSINKEKFKILLFDVGFWQIRKSLKDAKIGVSLLKEIKYYRDVLRENILKESYKFIS